MPRPFSKRPATPAAAPAGTSRADPQRMTIIAAVDLSPTTTNAARSAARLARKLGDRLLLVRVLEPVAALFPELSVLGGNVVPDFAQPLRDVNLEALKNLRASLMEE